MKQIKFFSVILIFVLFTASCNKTPKEKMSGKWDVEKIENSTMHETADIEFLNEMNANILKTEVFEFADTKVKKTLPEPIEGTWEIDEAGTVLTIDWGADDMYSPHKFNVKELTSEKLVIEEDFEEFFIKTTFVKVK
jgi:hypothetical protein